MNIEEVIDDFKDSVGNKGFFAIIGVIIFFFLVFLMKDRNSGSGLTSVTAVTSYPDASTNANVIIDTLQNNMKYNHDEQMEAIGNLGEGITEGFQNLNDSVTAGIGSINTSISEGIGSLNTSINAGFSATNDYINKGLAAQSELLKQQTDTIIGDIRDQSAALGNISGNISNVQKDIEKIQKETSEIQKNTELMKQSSVSVVKTPSVSNTYKSTSYGGSSIVDGLKSIGVNSSFTKRSDIAAANGIKNYTGTAAQNTKLLKLLKSGNLKKA